MVTRGQSQCAQIEQKIKLRYVRHNNFMTFPGLYLEYKMFD